MTAVVALGALMVVALMPASASAAPELDVKTQWGPTNLQPGDVGLIRIYIRNLGDAPAATLANGLTVTDQLPPGVTWVRHSGPTP